MARLFRIAGPSAIVPKLAVRHASEPGPSLPLATVLISAGMAMASVVSHTTGNESLLLAAVAVGPAGQTFECTPTRVWDGDGPVRCAEGPHIRLSGIAAGEIDGTCRTNQPCPKADAEQARDALVRLVGQPRGTSPQGHVLVRSPTTTCRSVAPSGGSRPLRGVCRPSEAISPAPWSLPRTRCAGIATGVGTGATEWEGLVRDRGRPGCCVCEFRVRDNAVRCRPLRSERLGVADWLNSLYSPTEAEELDPCAGVDGLSFQAWR